MDSFQDQIAEISKRESLALSVERKQNKLKAIMSVASVAAIPRRYVSANLTGGNDSQADAYAFASDYVGGFESRLESGAGVLLYGDIGTGKTHLACAMANELLGQMRSVMYCTVLEAVGMIKQSWGRGSDVSELDAYQQFAAPEFLILDEVGVQHGSEFEVMAIASIIDVRNRSCLPTVAISNHSPAEVMQILGERAFDRLMGYGGKVIEMRGRSLRHG